ncbi:MAG: glutamate--tRNA ligase, partial [Fusobacteriaceae bacterium]
DLVKLGWVNNQHMRLKDLKELTDLTLPFFRNEGFIGETVSEKEYSTLLKIVQLQRESCITLKEIAQTSAVYFKDEFSLPELNPELDKKELAAIERLYNLIKDPDGKKSIEIFCEKVMNFGTEEITVEEGKAILAETLTEVGAGPGKVYMPLRAVLTGLPKGVDLYNILFTIGRDRTVARIKNMIKQYNI